ncbi:hypothetical protein ANCCAN_08472 [Ancylostoma caninum]|uniref:Uncharacterized protein n=1 Tax=Ancylostoma caninum TaxID=29170 RepID=A0A368GMD3_ANCCA|nr:hypothetical protein ANCCAN_08472 [Ancylostoma caninum]
MHAHIGGFHRGFDDADQEDQVRRHRTDRERTRRHRPLNATFDTGEEVFLGTCDSRGVGRVGVLVNTNLVMNIDSFEQLTTRIGQANLPTLDVGVTRWRVP